MNERIHPREALFGGEPPFPILPSCEHYAGSEALITKALGLQDQIGPIFDVTMDCEDGAPAGRERQHAEMVVDCLRSASNRHRMTGVRVHDYSHPHWREVVDLIVGGGGDRYAYLTLPKVTSAAQVREMQAYIQHIARDSAQSNQAEPYQPSLHVLIETHGALRDAFEIAAIPGVEVLDFGLMDFVSSHHGAINAGAMKSPGQFEHALIVRAKARIAAAALANRAVPAHNVTLDVKNPEQTYHDARCAHEQFGFLRMWSVHPVQIRPIVEAMQPDFTQVERACGILLAAQAAQWGPIQFEGELQDRASYRFHWQLVRRAAVSGQTLPQAAQAWLLEPAPSA